MARQAPTTRSRTKTFILRITPIDTFVTRCSSKLQVLPLLPLCLMHRLPLPHRVCLPAKCFLPVFLRESTRLRSQRPAISPLRTPLPFPRLGSSVRSSCHLSTHLYSNAFFQTSLCRRIRVLPRRGDP